MAEHGINFNDDTKEKRGSKKGLWPEIDHLGVADLLALRAQIEVLLPATDLGDLDLSKELVSHFLVVKELMNDSMDEESVQVNQKAQLINSCASILQQMAKSQADLYNAERIKKIEQSVIEALKQTDEDVIDRFFMIYEELLEKASDSGS